MEVGFFSLSGRVCRSEAVGRFFGYGLFPPLETSLPIVRVGFIHCVLLFRSVLTTFFSSTHLRDRGALGFRSLSPSYKTSSEAADDF